MPDPTGGYRLPRSMRLTRSTEYETVAKNGSRLARGCLAMNWMVLPAGETSRVGVIASRRLGNAVERNRARRLLRETFRLRQFDLRSPVVMVLVARRSILGKKRSDVDRDFMTLLRRANLVKGRR